MWHTWIALLVSCALAVAEVAEGPVANGPVANGPVADGPVADGPVAKGPVADGPVATGPVATTRAPPRTLDRQLGELAWPSWIQNPENNNQNAPPRRITTKSLFITPLVCPKGHRLDGSACVQVLTVKQDDHEQILLQELNALYTSAPNNGDVVYDYGDEDPGPLQLSIPIGIDPLQESSPQAQDYVKVDKKGENTDASVEAELELLKLQQAQYNKFNNTQTGNNHLSHSLLQNLLTYSDKPKRDSPMINSTEIESSNSTDEGQKELVFGHVNVDPVLYDTEIQNDQAVVGEYETEKSIEQIPEDKNVPTANNTNIVTLNDTLNSTTPILKKNTDATKLNPENDYSDIGEAIKLISRYAEVSTDDNFNKDDKTVPSEDSVLGTRTKLQHRRNKPKPSHRLMESETPKLGIAANNHDASNEKIQPQKVVYYRYPWPSETTGSQPNYPFRHLQDYWPGRSQFGGVYNTMHGNPRRHHHSYPHYFRPRGYHYVGYSDIRPGLHEAYSELRQYPHKIAGHNTNPIRSHGNNQDLYSLLGLRHWFSSEGATKR